MATPDPFDFQQALLQDARNAFPQYYRSASSIDVDLMDALVVCHAIVVISINAPRARVAPVIRSALEQATNANEQLFTDIREAVRRSRTFSKLAVLEQQEIERVVFQVKHPSD